MEFDNYIFDFDGTIINSQEDVFLCFEKAFEKANYEIDKSRLTPDVIGPPLKGIIRLIAPELTDEDLINKICDIFRNIYDNDANDHTYIYDGVFDFLRTLKYQNKKIFMATFKPMNPTMMLVKKLGIEEFFTDIYGIDKFGKHITKEEMILDIISKYNLKKSKTVMIGDASTDVIAAKNAGIIGIGAMWGYGSDKTALIENSDKIINSIKEMDIIKL